MKGFEFPELIKNDDEVSKDSSSFSVPFKVYERSILDDNNEDKVKTTNPYIKYDNIEDVITEEDMPKPKEITELDDEIVETPVEDYSVDDYANIDLGDYHPEEYEVQDFHVEDEDEEEYEDYDEEEVVEDNDESEEVDETDDSFKSIYNEIKEEKKLKKEEFKEKSKDFRMAFVIIMTVIVIGMIGVYLNRSKEHDDNKPITIKVDTNKCNIDEVLNDVYESGNRSELDKCINNVNDKGKEDIKNKFNEKLDDSYNELINMDSSNIDEFNIKLESIRSFITIGYESNNNYSIIDQDSYDSKIEELEKAKEDAKYYYEGLDSFINKDYNNSYVILKNIDENNIFYNKSLTVIKDIYSRIMEMINNDVNNLSTNIELLSDYEKNLKYKEIKDIIEKYAIAYSYVDLNNNEDYKNILEKYTILSY